MWNRSAGTGHGVLQQQLCRRQPGDRRRREGQSQRDAEERERLTQVRHRRHTNTNLSYSSCTAPPAAAITCGFDGYISTPGRHRGNRHRAQRRIAGAGPGRGQDHQHRQRRDRQRGALHHRRVHRIPRDKTVIYLHSAPIAGLYVGQSVTRGQQIATESWRGINRRAVPPTPMSRCGWATRPLQPRAWTTGPSTTRGPHVLLELPAVTT